MVAHKAHKTKKDHSGVVVTARGIIRLAQILGIATISGVSLLPVVVRERCHDGVLAREAGRVTSACMWRLGPAFVKVGQLLCTRQDVFPAEWCEELQRSLAFGRPGTADATVARDAGEWPSEIGSVAKVRRETVDGRPVAVKTVRPGAVRQLETDLGLLRLLAAAVMIPLRGSAIPLPQIMHEICESVRRQTDLAAEADTLDRLAALEATLPVVVPKVLHTYSDTHQLVMSWLPHQETGRTFASDRLAAKRLVLAVYEMLFVTGIVHCDLHPGNWWELPDGRLAIVDAGFSYELDDDMRRHFAEFFLGMSSGNADVCATHALAACSAPVAPEDELGFRRDMQDLISSTTGLTAGDFSLARFARRFFAIQRHYHAYSRATFIFPFMALLAVEGQVKQLDPTINFQALAGPVVLRAIVNRSRRGSSDAAIAV